MKDSWEDIAGLLKWFHKRLKDTAYGNEIKIDKITKAKKTLKIQCLYSMDKYQNLVEILFRSFFLEESFIFKERYSFHSIKFEENSIEISRPNKNHQFIEKMEFKGKKKFYSFYKIKFAFPKEPPFITFPKEETFLASSAKNPILTKKNILT